MKLNLGCGLHAMSGWTNYDLIPAPGVTRLDLSLGRLPHSNESVDYIFSEHWLEHVTRDQALQMMSECKRVLKPKGVMRISTPELRHWAWKYLDGDIKCMPGVWEPMTPCQMLNEGLRAWGHTFVYDYAEMTLLLNQAGFQEVHSQRWRESYYSELRGLEVRPFNHDLIVEASKGGPLV